MNGGIASLEELPDHPDKTVSPELGSLSWYAENLAPHRDGIFVVGTSCLIGWLLGWEGETGSPTCNNFAPCLELS